MIDASVIQVADFFGGICLMQVLLKMYKCNVGGLRCGCCEVCVSVLFTVWIVYVVYTRDGRSTFTLKCVLKQI